MKKAVLAAIVGALSEQTSEGMFPLVGYGLEAGRLHLLTTTIPDLPLAIKILRDATGKDYNMGYHLHPDMLKRIAEANRHYVVAGLHDIPGLDLCEDTWQTLSRTVVAFGAPLYPQKGVGLVDICGFSRLERAEQLAALYSIENAFHSNVKRFAASLSDRIGVSAQFGHSSTGDGYYIWHDMIGGGADTATLTLLLCIMSQAEAYRLTRHFEMQLRAAFVVDSAFMVYDPEAFSFRVQGESGTEVYAPRPTAVTAVGVPPISLRASAMLRAPARFLLGSSRERAKGRNS